MKKSHPKKEKFLTIMTLIAFFGSVIPGILLGVIYDKILIGILIGVALALFFLRWLPPLQWI